MPRKQRSVKTVISTPLDSTLDNKHEAQGQRGFPNFTSHPLFFHISRPCIFLPWLYSIPVGPGNGDLGPGIFWNKQWFLILFSHKSLHCILHPELLYKIACNHCFRWKLSWLCRSLVLQLKFVRVYICAYVFDFAPAMKSFSFSFLVLRPGRFLLVERALRVKVSNLSKLICIKTTTLCLAHVWSSLAFHHLLPCFDNILALQCVCRVDSSHLASSCLPLVLARRQVF